MDILSSLPARARILRGIREFFWSQGFLEVETPVLLAHPSQEPELEPLRTPLHDHRGRTCDGFLRMSPEFSIKKILGYWPTVDSQWSGVFELGPVFRDGEPWGAAHNPEFTMLEWYRVGVAYAALMEDCEALLCALLHSQAAAHIPYRGQRIDCTPPWERLTMREAWQRYAHLDLDALLTRDAMAQACAARGLTVTPHDRWDDLFFKIHLTDVEPQLGRARPTFLLEWPAQLAALARRMPGDARYAERVELYIGGLELANGFSELTDSAEQRARFLEDQESRRRSGRSVYPLDEEFLAALDRMPPTSGIALGVDRLVMLLLDASAIEDVRLLTARSLWITPHGASA